MCGKKHLVSIAIGSVNSFQGLSFLSSIVLLVVKLLPEGGTAKVPLEEPAESSIQKILYHLDWFGFKDDFKQVTGGK